MCSCMGHMEDAIPHFNHQSRKQAESTARFNNDLIPNHSLHLFSITESTEVYVTFVCEHSSVCEGE